MSTPVIGLARWRVFLAFGVDVVCQFVRWNKWSTKTARPARLYKALEKRPMTSKELAKETGIAERYAREWLSHQAASGHLDSDPVCGAFTLTPEQAMVFAK